MAKFEVHIPAADAGGFNMTLKVDAENWMAALKAGMTKLGEQGATVQNVLVDIQDDNSIHVTEPRNGRVFRIRELTEEEAAKATVKRPSQIRAQQAAMEAARAKTQPTMPAVQKDAPAAGGKDPITEKVSDQTLRSAMAHDASNKATIVAKKPHNKSSPRIDVTQLDVQELTEPTKPITKHIGRPKSQITAPARVNVEDLLAEVFEKVQDIYQKKTPEEALEFILDLALSKVPSDAGSVLRADGATGDLTFVAARGPKAKELMSSKLVIPSGHGIAGFCSMEGVSVAVSDVDKDPRHYAAVSDKVDYDIKSLACAPMMTHGRSFGCVQLLNRKDGHTFAEHEIGVLSYLSHQAALYLNDRS